jgi:hypothetical protein
MLKRIIGRMGMASLCAAGVLSLLSPLHSSAQVNDPNSGIQFARGQDVVPGFEGWERNTDGTYTFLFGYLNHNYEEEVDVPVGPQNKFEPGNIDRGQPTHFYPRRHFFVFKVIVPKDWPADQKLVWTLTSRGKTTRAKGWLQPEWELNNGVISENIGSSTVDWSNEAPTVTGNGPQTVQLPNVATLQVTAADDGLPKPKAKKKRAEVPSEPVFNPVPNAIPEALMRGTGLNVRWILYRGPGQVTIDQPSSRPVFEPRVVSKVSVSFTAPGDYVLRAIASDGALEAFYDVPVKVVAAR